MPVTANTDSHSKKRAASRLRVGERTQARRTRSTPPTTRRSATSVTSSNTRRPFGKPAASPPSRPSRLAASGEVRLDPISEGAELGRRALGLAANGFAILEEAAGSAALELSFGRGKRRTKA